MLVHPAYMKKIASHKGRKLRPTFIRQWREHRNKSLETVAEAVGTTHATLSRIERGLIPYSQELLEDVADVLQTDVASLIMRNPTDDDAIWTLWDQAKIGERQMIVDLAKTVLRRGTGT